MSALDRISNNPLPQTQFRQGIEDTQHAVLTDIYQEDTNMVVWKRNLANNLEQAADTIIESQPTLEELLVVSPEEALMLLRRSWVVLQKQRFWLKILLNWLICSVVCLILNAGH
jgi:hypothetical protein